MVCQSLEQQSNLGWGEVLAGGIVERNWRFTQYNETAVWTLNHYSTFLNIFFYNLSKILLFLKQAIESLLQFQFNPPENTEKILQQML